jgi:hypothetical protein
MIRSVLISVTMVGILTGCGSIKSGPETPPPGLQVGDRLLKLSGPVGARCVANTAEGEIVLQQAPGYLLLPARHRDSTVVCTNPGGSAITIDLHNRTPNSYYVLNYAPDGKSYTASVDGGAGTVTVR